MLRSIRNRLGVYLMRISFIASLLPLAIIASTPAHANSSAAAESDMNRQICKKIEIIGSRLKTKKVCMTAGEWEAQRAQDRMDVERNQAIRTKGND